LGLTEEYEVKIATLERMVVGRKALEIEFLKDLEIRFSPRLSFEPT
jgi:hypothetical protein